MRRIALLYLAGMLLVIGCRTNLTPLEGGNIHSTRRVLIAGETSPFKRELVARLIEKLGARDCYYRIIGLSQLEQQETGQYRAILLVAGYRAGRIDERVSRFLQKDPTNRKLVVFYTRGTDTPLPDKDKRDIQVDALSSASSLDRADRLAEQLVALLEKRL